MANLVKLRRTMIRLLDEDDLRDLCFDLDVDYECLTGEGKRAKVRALITQLDHRGRIPDLVEAGRELRPDVSWEDVLGTRTEVPSEPAADEDRGEPLGRRGRTLRSALAISLLFVAGAVLLGVVLMRAGWPGLRPAATPVPPTATALPPTSTPTVPTPSPTAPSASPTVPISSPTPSLPVIEIVFIEYDPEGSDVEGEYLLLRNTTQDAQDLAGWTIEDGDGRQFRFDSFVLGPNATVKVWTGTGQDSETDVYWGYGVGLWDNDGDRAVLKDYQGRTVATYSYAP